MSYCSELESLPSNFFNKLTSLSTLYLRGCRRLKKLPEISENMYSLEELYLSETGIEEIPSSIGNLKGLKHLNMHNCRKLALLPKSFSDLASLGRLFLGIDLVPKGNKCELREARHPHLVDHHSLPLLLEGISCLRNLSLYNCNLVELPEDLSFISSLQILDLRGNNFKRISATIKQLSQLEVLNIRNCSRLLSLPELPLSVSRLYADDCRSLEKIWTLKQLISDSQGLVHKFYLFNNCFKLDEGECQAIAKALLTYQTTFTRNQIPKSAFRGNKGVFRMDYPGSRIPEWVKHQNTGDSIQIPLPSHWFNHLFLGFAFYVCLGLFNCDAFRNPYLRHDCYIGDNYGISTANFMYSERFYIHEVEKEHVVVLYSKEFCDWVCRCSKMADDVASFKFSIGNCASLKICKCGIIPLYAQYEDELCQGFDFPTSASTVKMEEAD